MAKLPRWLSFASLPLVAFLDYFAWYSTRMLVPIQQVEAGASQADLGPLLTAMTASLVAGTILAAIVGLATGPWVPLAVGAGLVALGAASFAVVPPDAVLPIVVVLALGHGMVRPALFGAAARAFSQKNDEHARNALFLALGMMPSVGGFLGPLVVGGVHSVGFEQAFFTIAVVALFAAVTASALGLIVFTMRGSPDDAARPAFRPAHLGVVVALLCAVALPWSSYGAVWTELFTTFGDHPAIPLTTLTSVNPIAITLLAPVTVLVALILHLAKVRVPTLLGVGVGLLLVGAGSALLLTADPTSDSVAALWSGLVIVSLGELLVTPLLLSRASAEQPKNLETAVVAGYLVLLYLPGLVGARGGALMWVGTIAAGVVGLALLGAAYPLERVFAPREEPPGPTEF